jgi:hypothetical protein
MTRKTTVILGVVGTVLVVSMALLAWKWDAVLEKLAGQAVEAERQAWIQRTRELEQLISRMEREKGPQVLLPEERLSEVFGPDSPLVEGLSPRGMKCRELEQSLRAFCRHLDQSQTLRVNQGSRESWTFFSEVLNTVARRPPTISGERYRAPLIIENSFYFFRLLGKKNTDVLREVLTYEADLAEPLMGLLYHWFLTGRQCESASPSLPALTVMYRYAGFFLDTLGGHSYLCRRDSRIRLLTLYYAVLVVHEANLRGVNELGFDLRFFLPLVFKEIQSRTDLLYAEEYLQTLSDLQLHYFHQG